MNYLTELKEGLLISFNAIKANKMRSILATLGIVIGIMAVTLLQTAIEGINRAFETSIASVGADVLYVQKFEWFSNEDWEAVRNRRDITYDQFEYLKDNIQSAESVSPSLGSMAAVTYKDYSIDMTMILGTTDEYQRTLNVNIDEGRFFTQKESEGGWPVCVIGYDIRDAFFQILTLLVK